MTLYQDWVPKTKGSRLVQTSHHQEAGALLLAPVLQSRRGNTDDTEHECQGISCLVNGFRGDGDSKRAGICRFMPFPVLGSPRATHAAIALVAFLRANHQICHRS